MVVEVLPEHKLSRSPVLVSSSDLHLVQHPNSIIADILAGLLPFLLNYN